MSGDVYECVISATYETAINEKENDTARVKKNISTMHIRLTQNKRDEDTFKTSKQVIV